ncbi:MAG TPA: FtsX-like permease family protein, partial [Nitrospira sp.]|nr:FtsX-like permease family protein [Nitrospira sp.]
MTRSLTSTLLFSHLTQRPFRALLSVVGVALGVLAAVAIAAANVRVLRSFEEAVTTVAGPATLEIVGGDVGLDEMLITAVRRNPGVAEASPIIEGTISPYSVDHRGEAVQVYGLDLLSEIGAKRYRVQGEGERGINPLLSSDALYLGEQQAREWRLQHGARLEVVAGGRIVSLRVVGFIHGEEGPSSFWDRVAVMDIAAAQVLFSSVGRLDRIDVVTEATASPDDVAAKLRSVLPPDVVVQRPAQRTKQVENMVKSFQLNLTVLSWVGLLIGTFLIYNTMAFAVAQRRREIGIYRALGMTESRVAALFLLEGAMLGVIGGLVGGLGGLWLSHALVALVNRTITDLYVPMVSEVSISSWNVETVRSLSKGMMFGGVVSMIGALAPSIEASRTIAVRALAPGDYEESQRVRTRLFLLSSVGLMAIAGLSALVRPVDGLPLFGYLATLCLLASLA